MMRAEGRYPTRRWYVVNQFCDRPPDQRGEVFSAAQHDVQEFAKMDGAVFDTVELFRAQRAVAEGRESAALLRAQMRDALGVFRHDCPDP